MTDFRDTLRGIVAMLRPTIDTLVDVAPDQADRVDSFARSPGILWARVFPGDASEETLWDGTSKIGKITCRPTRFPSHAHFAGAFSAILTL